SPTSRIAFASPSFRNECFFSYAAANFAQSLASATLSPVKIHEDDCGPTTASKPSTFFARTASMSAPDASSGEAKVRCAAAGCAAAAIAAAIRLRHLAAALVGFPAELLARLRGLRARPAIVFLRRAGIAIGRPLAMLGAMVEVAVADVRLVEIVVLVDVYVHVVISP